MPQIVSHNVRRFRFRLPDKKMVIGLPTGSHITIAAKDVDGKDVMRPYTPVTDDTSKGYVDFVIKVRLRASTLPPGGIVALLWPLTASGTLAALLPASWSMRGSKAFSPWVGDCHHA